MTDAPRRRRPNLAETVPDVPRHVAIIMDGNGRWAAARGLPRVEGHRRGVEALRKTVRAAGEIGIRCLTIFSFSSENWQRPASEVRDLMGLLRLFIRKDLAELHGNGVRVRVIGERDEPRSGHPPAARRGRGTDPREYQPDAGRRLQLRRPRRDRARGAAHRRRTSRAARSKPDAITEEMIGQHLDAPDIADPDLIIRTSGEQRLSNFLLWQAAYSELVFTPVYWPDFDARRWKPRSRNTAGANAASAVSPPRPAS